MAVGGYDPNVPGELCKKTKECLRCRVCLDIFKDPRVLECGHTFCLECIQSVYYGYTEGINSALCPLCKTRFLPKGRTVGTFPKNYLAMDCLSMLDKYDAEQRKNPKEERCEMCEDNEIVQATKYCVECSRFLCQKCDRKHMRLLATHVSMDLNDITDITVHGLLRSQKEDEDCQVHPGSKMTQFCVPCKTLLCDQCRVIPTHQNHRMSPVGSTVEIVQRDLSRLVSDCERYLKELERCRAYWTRIHGKLEDTHRSMREKAISRAEELRAMIDEKEAKTLSEIESHYTAKKTKLQSNWINWKVIWVTAEIC